jgi:ERCC4-related helicase
MERIERQELRAVSHEVRVWVEQARLTLAARAEVEAAGAKAVDHLRRAVVDVRHDGQSKWRILPLRHGDAGRLGLIARQRHLPVMSRREADLLGRLLSETAKAVEDSKTATGARRLVAGGKKREAGAQAARYLRVYRDWAMKTDLPGLIQRLAPASDPPRHEIPTHDALSDWVGLAPRIADLGRTQETVPVAVVSHLHDAVETVEQALRQEERLRSDAAEAGEALRRHDVSRLLNDMPVERLKEATRDRLRVGPLTDAGITTVRAVLEQGERLELLPGIGATTATRMRGAAQTLWQTTYDEMPVRIDLKDRSREATELLRRLGAWDAMRKTKSATTDLAWTAALSPLARALDQNVTHLLLLSARPSGTEFHNAVETVTRRARSILSARPGRSAQGPWEEFLQRPADYFAMLAELGFLTEDEEKTHGDLPDHIIEAVRRLELNTQHLSASLRGYQSFGARFALVQRKVIIGDEMGLGKTIEALAVMAHLRAKGDQHALVVCPAAVVTNWIREVQSKSTLRAHRLHGTARESGLRSWMRGGGVAVTTFETLAWLEPRLLNSDQLACVVIDEAHYIKNPFAKRSERAARLINRAERTLLLTGTPLENRLEEFRTLVGYLRPDLTVDANEFTPNRFRRQVAPAYLRRNQEDVLTELPELVEVEEWLPMSGHDTSAYRDAVAAGNFMAMRQAAMVSGPHSEKLRRLVDIVEEAEDNGRRVIVFSHFRQVLDQVAQSLKGQVFGPLTGSVPAAARQIMVDRFSAAGHGAVLVSQIVAGGVGLNIQAASVVVICEPQLKPTTEWQAIARARRMGQLESVQVHRLLSEEGVDERITEILARKRELFDEFARVSETAGSAPEALDVSEAQLAREVVAAERERLFANASAPQVP